MTASHGRDSLPDGAQGTAMAMSPGRPGSDSMMRKGAHPLPARHSIRLAAVLAIAHVGRRPRLSLAMRSAGQNHHVRPPACFLEMVSINSQAVQSMPICVCELAIGSTPLPWPWSRC